MVRPDWNMYKQVIYNFQMCTVTAYGEVTKCAISDFTNFEVNKSAVFFPSHFKTLLLITDIRGSTPCWTGSEPLL